MDFCRFDFFGFNVLLHSFFRQRDKRSFSDSNRISSAHPAPVAVTQAGPEPNPEVRAQPATAVTPPERQSRSSEAFGESAQGTRSGRSTTYELATTTPESAEVMLWNRSNSPVKRFSSRRRVALGKRAPQSIRALIEMWFRGFRTRSHR